MPAIAIVGAQWGDEGKGKIVDMVAEKADIVVRYSGGDNAGHTVINHFGEFKLHLVPCGMFYPHTICIIGNGVVINPAVLLNEIDDIKKRVKGIDFSRLVISDRANLIMPYHILLDGLEEKALGAGSIGTTLKGVGPAFTDKTARLGIRAGDLLDKDAFYARLKTVLERKNLVLTRAYGAKALALDEIFQQYWDYGKRLAPYIRETSGMIFEAVKKKQTIMLEGAQGVLLDPDFGTYPYGTSSSPMAANASLGSGIGPLQINQILAVYKAYCTRVGEGPMPTELKNEVGERIRRCAQEFGATTGRPRRCGWFDGVAARYSSRINGYNAIALTRLDVLDEFSEIDICTAYRVNNQTLTDFPSRLSVLEKCQPVYESMEGWKAPTCDIRQFARLPSAARRYVKRLEEICGCPVKIISVGPKREQTIIRTKII